MIKWFKELSTLWKILLLVGVLILSVFVYDLFTGTVSSFNGWRFNKATAERLEKADVLEKENIVLRTQIAEMEKKVLETDIKYAVLNEKEKGLDIKAKAEIEKVDKLLEDQNKEEAITSQPTDAYTRCERTKEKMLAIPTLRKAAEAVNCDVKK